MRLQEKHIFSFGCIRLICKTIFPGLYRFIAKYGSAISKEDHLKNVDIKHQDDGTILIRFERSITVLNSIIARQPFDLAECNRILVASGRELFEAFDFQSPPLFTETCSKLNSLIQNYQQESQIPATQTAFDKTTTTTTKIANEKAKNKFKTPVILPGVRYVRKYKLLIRMTLVMKYTADYRNPNSLAYRKLEENVDRFVR